MFVKGGIYVKNNPFIPYKKGNLVIIDGRVDEKVIKFLEKLNIKVIKTVKCEDVHEAIAYHPDIVLHPINYKTLIVAPNVFEYYEEKFFGTGIELIRGEKQLVRDYPGDIAYNVGRVYGYAIHNFKYTDEKLLFYLKKEGLELIHVNQGYTKCSMAVVDEKAIITADRPIYEAMTKYYIDTLLIEPGHIKLEGFNYGFIGGCFGSLCKNDIFISGKFNNHPDKDKIKKFLKKHKKNLIFLSNDKIVDLGTIITLYC
ncbi:hypothetical protein L0P54_09495 [Anaerosalibacter bizertensis]|uniref:DUF6873 domain-containing protein n=2 Tax=Anaerosalibacter bizertensis TaxID=932217 RepID=A0A9Q4ADG5_9FIRM|nr:hypothetical protein [Anaerosalibacter bizertensis]MBV1819651.1 hypothetical protein [Bacteroidales bacterium MSK.15.36]MCB5560300.1 hypothetical protein [Anaerosalibacter bizertensis]MCG4565888.1 hypothetical protein [Anaerosalibacter bizertensis]MCG4583222.1 hypothetical protein [Anaerosalibacter bizertensis]MCG4586187.1 hypothetical protein [Anaerosalibacter bizertensis]